MRTYKHEVSEWRQMVERLSGLPSQRMYEPPVAGPWDEEPDKAQWVDEATGLDCLIVRNQVGALCGYVGLPPGHPLHGASALYSGRRRESALNDLDVHGGITFANSCQGDEDDPSRGICHVPEPGRPRDVWWLGFDCAHAFDLTPADASLTDEWRHSSVSGREAVYWTFGSVVDECRRLAAQLVEA